MKSPKNIFFAMLISAICLLFLFTNLSSQQTAGELYEKALYLEEAKGDLQKAIELYEKILKQFPEIRGVAAKAQLHIGLCYEKLGLKEAQKAFQKVIDNFPEQAEAVKVAREKLLVLLKAQAIVEEADKGFTIQKVWTGSEADGLAAISPDGRYLAYTDWNTGNLAILEITTGEKRNLTNKGSWIESREFALFLAWSPDSKQIAYNWWDEPNYVDMRVIALDGSKPHTIHKTKNPDKEVALVYEWSPDGKHILTLFWEEDLAGKIGLVSVADGSEYIIKTLELKRVGFNEVFNIGFSPDGQYIIYDYPAEENSLNSDIYLLSVDGKQEIPLVEHPAHDVFLGWMPDGKNIIFASDRRGTLDAWIMTVEKGKRKRDPELIKESIGEIYPQGFTQKGSFYYVTSKSAMNVYVTALDSGTGNVIAPPKNPIKHLGKSTHSPSYSPDGKSLAFVSVRGLQINTRSVLCIRSLETGKDQELIPELNDFWDLRWSPDSRFILALAADKSDRTGHSLICTIDTRSGEVSPIAKCQLPRRQQWFVSAEWSLDGKSIFYVRNDKDLCQLLVRDLEEGKERELYRASRADRFTISRSPDGKWLSLFNFRSENTALKIIPAAGGEPRELCKFEHALNWKISAEWTADGKYILYLKQISEKDEEMGMMSELWRIPIEGGEVQYLGLTMARISQLSTHPDGSQIAFSSYGPSLTQPELWVMENFLPEDKQ